VIPTKVHEEKRKKKKEGSRFIMRGRRRRRGREEEGMFSQLSLIEVWKNWTLKGGRSSDTATLAPTSRVSVQDSRTNSQLRLGLAAGPAIAGCALKQK
jgi:hypothetical protein